MRIKANGSRSRQPWENRRGAQPPKNIEEGGGGARAPLSPLSLPSLLQVSLTAEDSILKVASIFSFQIVV